MRFFFAETPKLAVSMEDEPSGLLAPNEYTLAIEKAHHQLTSVGLKIRCEDFIDWLQKEGGLPENLDTGMGNLIDVFHEFDSNTRIPVPFRTGPSSLNSKTFHITDSDSYTKTLEKFEPEFLQKVVDSHRNIQQTLGYKMSDVPIDLIIDGRRYKGKLTAKLL